MTVWIFNPFDDVPGEGKPLRYWSLALALAEEGEDVVWWSSDFSHRRKARRRVERADTAGQQPGRKFQMRLVVTPAYAKNISLRRIWNHRCWGRRLYREACQSVDSGELPAPDLILASLPPMEGPITALRLRQRYGCRVVTDLMDAWPDTLLQAVPTWAAPLGRCLLQPYRRMLRRACGESDALSAQSEAFARFALKHRGRGDAVGAGHRSEPYVCYLGADSPASGLEEDAEPPGDSGPLRLIYLGAMGRSYDLETILEAVQRLNVFTDSGASEEGGHRVLCRFVGDGEKRAELEARKVPGVRFTGYLNGDALHRELAAADLGLVPFFPQSGVAMPYKAGEYLAYGLPLLSTIDGELGALIRRHGCGTCYSAGAVGALTNHLQGYLSDPRRLIREKKAANQCFAESFDRKKIYPPFARWMADLP